jgi:hypothetical protein
MGLAVVTVAAGGIAVVETLRGTPVTEAPNKYGLAVTKVTGKPGLPVVYSGGSGGGFAPSDLTGLAAWYDASDLASITKDGANRISAIANKGGGAGSMVQATGANQPFYAAAGLNSKPAIFFDASVGILSLKASTVALAASDKLAVFVVAKIGLVNGSGSCRVISTGLAGGGEGPIPMYRADGTVTSGNLAAYRGGPMAESVTPTAVAWTAANIFDGANNTMYVNGVAGAPVASTGAIDIDELALAVQGGSANSTWWDGYISEVVLVTGGITATERTQLFDYLKAKWNVT